MEENKNRILTELPRRGKLIDYKTIVGMELELLYKDEIYTGVKVLEYIKSSHSRFVVEYDGRTHNIECHNFIKGKFGGILGAITRDFKINIGDVLKDDKRDMVITDKEYKKDKNGINRKWYKYTCNKCGWTEGWIMEGNLLRGGKGCGCCAGKTAVLGINTIWDTDRWLCTDHGLDIGFAKTHTIGTHEKASFTCVHCGKVKETVPASVRENRSIGCICSDGISYPEKFVYSTLKQLVGAKFKTQLNKSDFDWIGGYRYDFYIPSLNMIIETHGMQHYEDCAWSKVKDVQENDRIKYELALQNGIKDGDYIVIDCRYSDKEWVKNNILSSKLNELFDLEKRINWSKCEEFALSNIVKEVCEYWSRKEDWETTTTLVKVFGLSKFAITNYLKKGAVLGWCEYDTKEEMIKNAKLRSKSNSKRVAMYDLDGNFIAEYPSTKELVEKMLKGGIKLDFRNISLVCNGKRKMHKGYIFKYIED